MPDITMCTGEGCPRVLDCYRYTARPSKRDQSYMDPPICPHVACVYFWDNTEHRIRLNKVLNK